MKVSSWGNPFYDQRKYEKCLAYIFGCLKGGVEINSLRILSFVCFSLFTTPTFQGFSVQKIAAVKNTYTGISTSRVWPGYTSERCAHPPSRLINALSKGASLPTPAPIGASLLLSSPHLIINYKNIVLPSGNRTQYLAYFPSFSILHISRSCLALSANSLPVKIRFAYYHFDLLGHLIVLSLQQGT